MNDTSVHTILAAISEAKLALDREPEYKRTIVELERSLNDSQRHNQQLELNAIDRSNEIMQLQSKVRSLEVERDDASFRNLELEDKVAGYAKLVNDFTSNIESLRYDFQRDLEALEPKKVEPELPPSVEPVFSVAVPDPFVGSINEVKETLPLPPSTTPSAPTTEAMPASVSSVQEPSSVSDTSTELPYKGKRYSEIHTLVNLDDWLAGGGTKNDFWQ